MWKYEIIRNFGFFPWPEIFFYISDKIENYIRRHPQLYTPRPSYPHPELILHPLHTGYHTILVDHHPTI